MYYKILITTLGILLPMYAWAATTYTIAPVNQGTYTRFNSENWNTILHPTIAEFTVRDDGSAYGLTTTGIPFLQYYVPNDLGIRVQRFEIEDHHHYIVEGIVVYTLQELSTELARAYDAQTQTT